MFLIFLVVSLQKKFYGAIENLPSSISIPEALINGVGGFKIASTNEYH